MEDFPSMEATISSGRVISSRVSARMKRPGSMTKDSAWISSTLERMLFWIVRVDDLVSFFVPDEVIAEADVQRVGLDELRIVGFYADVT